MTTSMNDLSGSNRGVARSVNTVDFLHKMDSYVFNEICDDLATRWRELAALIDDVEAWKVTQKDIEVIATKSSNSDRLWSCASNLLYAYGEKGMKVKHLVKYLDKMRMERVLLMLKAPENLIIILEPELVLKVKQGDPLVLECQAEGFPYPRYTWFHQSNHSQDFCEVGLSESEDGKLVIEDAQPGEHSGAYICRVWRNNMNDQLRWSNNQHWTQVTVTPRPDYAEFMERKRAEERLRNLRLAAVQAPQPPVLLAPVPVPRREPLVMIQHPVEHDGAVVSVGVRSELRLKCLASAHPEPEYQWLHDDVAIPGATEPELLIRHASERVRGRYQCLIRNNVETLRSKTAKVQVVAENTVKNKVTILTHPSNTMVEKGCTGILCVEAEGLGQLCYQWYFNGNPLPDERRAELRIACADKHHEGEYQVHVTTLDSMRRPLAYTLSHKATVTVNIATEKPTAVKGKVALVIGISPETAEGKLMCVINDIIKMTALFEEMDFKVFSFFNLTKKEIDSAVEMFVSILEEGFYGAIYLAGHGITVGGQHFLLPVDPPEGYELKHLYCCEKLIAEGLRKKPKLLFVILDMCRTFLSRLHHPKNGDVMPHPYLNAKLDTGNLCRLYPTAEFHKALEPILPTNEHINELLVPLRFPDTYGILCKHLQKVITLQKSLSDVYKDLRDDIYQNGDFKHYLQKEEFQIPNLDDARLDWRTSLRDPVIGDTSIGVEEKWKKVHIIPHDSVRNIRVGEENITLSIRYKKLLTNVLKISLYLRPNDDDMSLGGMKFSFTLSQQECEGRIQIPREFYDCQLQGSDIHFLIGGLHKLKGNLILKLSLEMKGNVSRETIIDCQKPLISVYGL